MVKNIHRPTKVQKIKRWLEISLILAVCLFIGILLLSSENNIFVFKHATFLISSSSMEPAYPVNSIVVIKQEDFDSLDVGDVIVFKAYALNGGLAMHRIVHKTEQGFYTKGDNNSIQDNQLITVDEYVGKAVYSITTFASYVSLIATPLNFILFLVLPVLVIILLLFAVKILSKENRQK